LTDLTPDVLLNKRDHKRIWVMFLAACSSFFALVGVFALASA